MKTLKTGILTVIIAFYCLTNVQAQENARGKLKGKVVKSSDTGMISVNKDTLSDPTSDSEKKGLNAVNVKLARGIDKKDIRRNVGASPDTISNPTLRKGWDGSVKGNKTDGQMQSNINTSRGNIKKIKIDDHPDSKTQEGSGTTDDSEKKGITQSGIKKNEADANTDVTPTKGIKEGGLKKNEASFENDSIPSASSERAINESGVSVKSNKPKK